MRGQSTEKALTYLPSFLLKHYMHGVKSSPFTKRGTLIHYLKQKAALALNGEGGGGTYHGCTH